MESKKAFTMIELLVVLLIIGILSAMAISLMRGRVDSAKWSEGRAAAGSIRTAARAFMGEKGPDWTGDLTTVDLATLGFKPGDLTGKFFTDSAYSIKAAGYDNFVVTVTAAASTSPEKPAAPAVVTLDQDGNWTVDGVPE
ncbi:MAG: type II secretion system protein [Planctomycetota bacterium]|nr:MAG: type II secretion system protein [Planctomycetota bacterium]